ncbi:hypothetical protein FQN57_005607 [Myotisia sp. PD_48]|nr:hypothetical protein FQN57_005607 [Myotisia sp. PD_48]
MASVLHRCPYCAYETDLSTALPVFSENPHCQQCGLSASEGDIKMDNDLADLFARKMAMEPQSTTSPNSASSFSAPQATAPPIVYSITQHYHHSSHQALPTPSSTSVEDILRNHNVDPACLYPSQLHLFSQADQEQRTRLIELWRISPSIPAGDINPSQTQQSTGQDSMMMVDFDPQHTEPYVVSGYESLAQRDYQLSAGQSHSEPCSRQEEFSPDVKRACDPVHKQVMENQYGAYELKKFYMGCGVSRAHWLDDHQML